MSPSRKRKVTKTRRQKARDSLKSKAKSKDQSSVEVRLREKAAVLRESEERHRALFDSIDEGVCIIEQLPVRPDGRRDYRYIAMNPAMRSIFDIPDLSGQSIRANFPDEVEDWYDDYDRVLETGQPIRFERHSAPQEMVLEMFLTRLEDGSGKRLLAVMKDVTARKQAEETLRESEARQAFLLNLSDAMRAEPDGEAAASTFLRLLAENLQLDRAYVATVYTVEDRVEVHPEYRRPDLQPMPALLRPSDFPKGFRLAEEGTLVVDDTAAHPRLSDVDRQSLGALDLNAFVVAGLRKGEGNLIWAVVAGRITPRKWKSHEIILIEEAAERAWLAMERARSEEALRTRETELAQVQRIGGIGGVDIDIAGGMTGRRSPEYLRLHGLPPEAAIETHEDWLRRVHPDDRARVDRIFRAALDDPDGHYESEYRIIRPSDGEERWIFAKADIERDEADKPLRMIGAHIDITERKHAEIALQWSEDRFRTLFNSIDEGFCVIEVLFDERGEAADYQFVQVNAAFERHTGIKDALGRRMGEIAPAHEKFWFETYGRIVRTGEPERFESKAEALDRWYDVYAFRIGEPDEHRVGVLFNDIKQRKLAEAALRESETRLRHIIDSAVEYAIITLDAQGCIQSWNTGAERLLGYTEAEIVGQSGEIFFNKEDRDAGQPATEMQRARETGRAANERWHVRKDGSRFWGSGVMLPLSDSAPDMFLKIFRDRTEERRAEERQQTLVNELNHRVKNTLATVQAIASQTFKGNPGAAARTAFDARLQALASGHDVLTQQSWERADLQQIVKSALRPFEALGQDRLQIDGPNFFIVPKPALALTMALHELATNATKYGALSNDTGRVTVSWRVQDSDEPRLCLRWEERGGPPVKEPRTKGFGSRLIERSLVADLAAKVWIEYDPEGVVCTFDAPLTRLQGMGSSVESMIGGEYS